MSASIRWAPLSANTASMDGASARTDSPWPRAAGTTMHAASQIPSRCEKSETRPTVTPSSRTAQSVSSHPSCQRRSRARVASTLGWAGWGR